jgi:hypothetical protein
MRSTTVVLRSAKGGGGFCQFHDNANVMLQVLRDPRLSQRRSDSARFATSAGRVVRLGFLEPDEMNR